MADARFFKNCGPLSLKKVVEIAKAELSQPLPQGVDMSTLFYDVAPLQAAQNNDIAVFHNPKYRQALQETAAGICIVSPEYLDWVPSTAVALLSPSPYRAYAFIASAFYPESFSFKTGANQAIEASAKIGTGCTIEPGVVIGANAEIGNSVHIAANTVIGHGVVIGDECCIGANVSLSHSILGRGVVVYPGARIGQPGFGFYMDDTGHIPVPQLGRVLIEDGCEIGSNTTIDRGSAGDTIIGAGSRLDNLIQIAHNVQLGKGCVIVAQVGISGSTQVGDFAAIAGQAGITGHLKIGTGARIAAQSGVMRDVPEQTSVGGSPAVPAQLWHRQTVALKRLTQGNRTKRDAS